MSLKIHPDHWEKRDWLEFQSLAVESMRNAGQVDQAKAFAWVPWEIVKRLSQKAAVDYWNDEIRREKLELTDLVDVEAIFDEEGDIVGYLCLTGSDPDTFIVSAEHCEAYRCQPESDRLEPRSLTFTSVYASVSHRPERTFDLRLEPHYGSVPSIALLPADYFR